MPTIVFASHNRGKVKELQALFADTAYVIQPLSDWSIEAPPETGLTFVENALIKARHSAKHTGLAAIADDSGLVVPALQGAPGIFSARYAGEHASDQDNIEQLLAAMADLPPEQRGAYYFCSLVWLRHPRDPAPLICQAQWAGEILTTPRGGGGFGYDPLFWLPELASTAAELAPELKNQYSHRGQAVRQLLALASTC